MTSKGSWDGLTGPLISWVIGLTALVLMLGIALAKYGDLGGILTTVR